MLEIDVIDFNKSCLRGFAAPGHVSPMPGPVSRLCVSQERHSNVSQHPTKHSCDT
jgi:hypothetical protein